MPDTPPPYEVAGPWDLEGLSLARTISRLGVVSSRPATFLWDSASGLDASWQLWLETCFTPVLAPAFVAVHRLAGVMQPDEIIAIDRGVDPLLSEPLRLRSLSAALPFLSGKEEMRAHRAWIRVVDRITRGDSPGHLVTLFALQAALYALPLASALVAYVWFELESGLPAAYRSRSGSAAEVLAMFADAMPQVQLAMKVENGDISGEVSLLRAI